MFRPRPFQFSWLALLTLIHIKPSLGILPNANIELYIQDSSSSIIIDASAAAFGAKLQLGKPEKSGTLTTQPLPIRTAPDNNPYLCYNVETASGSDVDGDIDPFIMLIPRGGPPELGCFFEQKVFNAQKLGASFAIIYNNLSSQYILEKPGTPKGSLWPRPQDDYECQNGKAQIPRNFFSFNPRYNGELNDPLLSGSQDNTCSKYEVEVTVEEKDGPTKEFDSSCASHRCFLTGNKSTYRNDVLEEDEEFLEACCAWDFHTTMHPNSITSSDGESAIKIPSVFITMKDGDTIVDKISKDRNSIKAIIYEKSRPGMNISNLLLLLLTVFATWISSWKSAQVYRIARKQLESTDISMNSEEAPPIDTIDTSRGENVDEHDLGGDLELTQSSIDNRQEREESASSNTEESNEQNPRVVHEQIFTSAFAQNSERADLKRLHAVTVVAVASILLLVLFFARIYNVVTTLYAIGGTISIVKVIIAPALKYAVNKAGLMWMNNNIWRSRCLFDLNKVTIVEALASLFGAALGISWLWFVLTTQQSENHPFHWIVQDIMGVCICIVFCCVALLENIQVATYLLLAVFLFSIFFLFVTRSMFGDNMMMGTEYGDVDKSACEEYPDKKGCNFSPLPILLSIPKINDYAGGHTMLGLGDIVVPGLLMSFAARLDAAKRLAHTTALRTRAAAEGVIDISNVFHKKRFFSGYFYRLVIAYAIGLLLAMLGDHLTDRGQPALMYIAPLILATILITGKRKGELTVLWKGSKTLGLADKIVAEIDLVGPGRVGVDPLDDISIYTGSSHTGLITENEVI